MPKTSSVCGILITASPWFVGELFQKLKGGLFCIAEHYPGVAALSVDDE